MTNIRNAAYNFIIFLNSAFSHFMGRYLSIDWKEENCWKTDLALAPDYNKDNHVNFSANIGVTWRR